VILSLIYFVLRWQSQLAQVLVRSFSGIKSVKSPEVCRIEHGRIAFTAVDSVVRHDVAELGSFLIEIDLAVIVAICVGRS